MNNINVWAIVDKSFRYGDLNGEHTTYFSTEELCLEAFEILKKEYYQQFCVECDYTLVDEFFTHIKYESDKWSYTISYGETQIDIINDINEYYLTQLIEQRKYK
jgi:hypothetical protein